MEVRDTRAPSHLIFLKRHTWPAFTTLGLCLRQGPDGLCWSITTSSITSVLDSWGRRVLPIRAICLIDNQNVHQSDSSRRDDPPAETHSGKRFYSLGISTSRELANERAVCLYAEDYIKQSKGLTDNNGKSNERSIDSVARHDSRE
ncbi:hypothetical protein N7517_011062 [Penicillium concentricum]|uniref:Uncharacterized protein n=1 Tax=Penicillium concentricum TaxID=293559 RepID=A0A9W9UT10_9EURO|nr:uncharacterized protein N7517_011062 [Penicillium concentricum]KAJ5356453.1 hypothetical protein N7517_011062 [Penicillium concentricum]